MEEAAGFGEKVAEVSRLCVAGKATVDGRTPPILCFFLFLAKCGKVRGCTGKRAGDHSRETWDKTKTFERLAN